MQRNINPVEKKVLSILVNLHKAFSKNKSAIKSTSVKDVLDKFDIAKNEIFNNSDISEEIKTEILKLRSLLNNQLYSLLEGDVSLNGDKVLQALYRAGFLYAANTTEAEIKTRFLKEIRDNISSEEKIESAIKASEYLGSKDVSLNSIQPCFNDQGILKTEVFDDANANGMHELKSDSQIENIPEKISKKISIKKDGINQKSIFYGCRRSSDKSTITRQECIVSSVIHESHSKIMESLLPDLQYSYDNSLGPNAPDAAFYKGMTNATILEDFCKTAFKDVSFGSPMILKDPVKGYEFQDGFLQSLNLAINHPSELTPDSSVTITREQLLKRYATTDITKVKNPELASHLSKFFFQPGEGGLKQIGDDCCKRDTLVEGHPHMDVVDKSKRTFIDEETLRSSLELIIGDDKSANKIINAHSQGGLLVTVLMGSPDNKDEIIIKSPVKTLVVIKEVEAIPEDPELDTFYLRKSRDGWRLTYINSYGDHENPVEHVKELSTILAGPNLDKTLLQSKLMNYLNSSYLQRINYAKDRENDEIYYICDYKLFPITNIKNMDSVDCLGSARARFKYHDRGELKYILAQEKPNTTIDYKKIEPNTFVFIRDQHLEWRCIFKNAEGVTREQDIIKDINTKITDALKALPQDQELAPEDQKANWNEFQLTEDQKTKWDKLIQTLRHGFELVDIQTNDPYIVQALNDKKFTEQEIYAYRDFNHTCHHLQQAIKEKRASGKLDQYTQRSLINSENTMNKVRKDCCNGLISIEEATAIIKVKTILNTQFISDVIDRFKQFHNKQMHQGHGGIATMINYSDAYDIDDQTKWNQIVKECKYRTTSTSSIGGFLKNSLFLHKLSPRTDAVDLIYRAIAETLSNFKFNSKICTLEQLIIAQQKRDAIAILEKEIRRLRPSSVGEGKPFDRSQIFPCARLKIQADEELIKILTESNHTKSLKEILNEIFESDNCPDEYKLQFKDSEGDFNVPIKDVLYATTGRFGITAVTSATVIDNLIKETIDPRSVVEGGPYKPQDNNRNSVSPSAVA